MELVSNDVSTAIQLPLSALKLIGRGARLSTTDRTVAKHQVYLKAEEAFVHQDDAPPPGNWWEKPPLKAGTGKGQKGLRAWVEVLGPNPICVLKETEDSEGEFEVKFFGKGEGCWLMPGDQLSLSIVKPSFFTVKKAGAQHHKESDTVDKVQRGDSGDKNVASEPKEDMDRKGKQKVEAAVSEDTARDRKTKRRQREENEEEREGPRKRPALQRRNAADRSTVKEANMEDVSEDTTGDERPASPQQDVRAGPSEAFDPVKEYGLVVEGAEFDQYDQKRLNNTCPWSWQIQRSKGDDDDSEGGAFSDGEEEKAGGSTRGAKAAPRKKKARPDEEDEWTGDSEEEAEDVEEVGKALRGLAKAPAVATRLHDWPRGKKRTESDVSDKEESETASKGRGTQSGKKVKDSAGSKAAVKKGAAAKESDTKKGASWKKKLEEDSEESEEDEPTAEDLDFIVDDEEELEEEDEESEEEWEDEDDQEVPKKKSKSKQPAQDTRPMCRYGAKCYRKNPDHLKQFRHP